jgi:hypothetical protein
MYEQTHDDNQHGATLGPESVAFPAAVNHSPLDRRMIRHVKILAYCSLAFGLFFLLGVVASLFHRPLPPGTYEPAAMNSPHPTLALISLIIFVLPLFCIFAGLKSFKPWGRNVGVALAILMIVLPLSWYALWVLNHEDTKRLFGGAPTRQPLSRTPLRTIGQIIGIAFVILFNIGIIKAFLKDVTGPSSIRPIPISDVLSGRGSDAGYCGIDRYGHLSNDFSLVSIEGTVADINSPNRTYTLQDTSYGINVVVHPEFPMPAIHQRINLMGIVRCPLLAGEQPISASFGEYLNAMKPGSGDKSMLEVRRSLVRSGQ